MAPYKTEKWDAAKAHLLAGKSTRSTAALVGLARGTVKIIKKTIQQEMQEIKCNCGKLIGHTGNCPYLYSLSPLKQAAFAKLRRPPKHSNELLPGALYLGLLWGTSLASQGISVVEEVRCHIKACPRAALCGGTLCLFHINVNTYDESMTGDVLDWEEIKKDTMISVLGRGRDYVVFEHKGKRTAEYL
jgi:hypothetical protein